MGLVSAIKSKIGVLLIAILVTALTITYVGAKHDRDELKRVSEKLTAHVQLNERLSQQNLELAEQIKNMPDKFITITRDVEKEVCNGKVKQELINAIPSKKGESNEAHTADIDDHLPDDLIRLLK